MNESSVRSYVHVTPRREVALLPGVVIGLPFRRQSRERGRRQVGCIPTQEGGERREVGEQRVLHGRPRWSLAGGCKRLFRRSRIPRAVSTSASRVGE